ncbi:MAG: hypothetical protein LQ350_006313 [Teloschistes chrysophthalmus]|nr:MAG: hypothetical protein LQ350_006313 [Niorma chrysophthalma]
MAPIPVPDDGILLRDAPCSTAEITLDESKAQPQVMRLDLADGVLEGIVKASRLGKDTLHFGNRSHQLLSIAQPTRSELYQYTDSHEDELCFAGILTHKLAQKKVQENTAGADAAAATLQSQMATHQQNKQSKRIKILSETPVPSPVIKSTHPKSKAANFFAAVRGQGTKKPTTSLSGAISRSTANSPTITAIRSGQVTPSAPRSAPPAEDEKAQKLKALKVPLLHLVAIRPMSLQYLANRVGCSQGECMEVLEKIGKKARLDPDKWDLSDKAFKDLDVWKFAYDLDYDRELAIEHAISAYDRMRLSRDDELWQLLLPKEERDKGKVLSKLQLHQGPIQQSGTPRIHVQRTTDEHIDSNTPDGDVDEKHHLAPGGATPMARSQSAELAKKKRLEEAQAKRLLSTKPKKAAPTPQAKQSTKKKVTKKAASAEPNVKSTEFVHDSDEEDEGEDNAAPAPKAAATPTLKQEAKVSSKKPLPEARQSAKQTQQVKKNRELEKSANELTQKPIKSIQSPSTTGTPNSRHRASDASQSSTASSKLSRQRTTSSPLKPSPLGSSPPTNASDLDNDNHLHQTSSSTSSTPLFSQSRNPQPSSRMRPEAAKQTPNRVEFSSDRPLKRKANDIESGIHNHKVSGTEGLNTPAAKRAKTSLPSPPAFDSSSSDSSPFSENLLSQAQRFKNVYSNYEQLYQELSAQDNPAAEKVDRLMKMHERLESMKDDIGRATHRR